MKFKFLLVLAAALWSQMLFSKTEIYKSHQAKTKKSVFVPKVATNNGSGGGVTTCPFKEQAALFSKTKFTAKKASSKLGKNTPEDV